MYVVKMAERLNTMFSLEFGGFRSQLEASCVSSHPEELWYNETVSLWITYIYLKKAYLGRIFSFKQVWLNKIESLILNF